MVHHFASFCFQFFECLANIPEVPLLALHLPEPYIEAITCLLQIVTYAVREKEMEYKGKLW